MSTVKYNSRNNSIDIFRYIASILIVALHTTAFIDIHPLLSYFFSQALPRIAVPFFFSVSGYYIALHCENNTFSVRKYLAKILSTYTIWSIFYFCLELLLYHKINFKSFITSYFFTGTAYHFWYFPALIIIVILVTVIIKCKLEKILFPISIILYVIGCLGHSYYEIGATIPLINQIINYEHWIAISRIFCLGLPFFICGYMIKQSTKYHRSIYLDIFAFIFFIVEIILLKFLNISNTITQTIGLYYLCYRLMNFLLMNPLPKHSKLASILKALANYTFYSHVLFITIIDSFITSLTSETLLFFVVVTFTSITGYLLIKMDFKITKILIR